MRPVIDLSVLNQYLMVPHLKMETNRSIRGSIPLGMWTTSLDLTDAYFHIPISPKFRKFLIHLSAEECAPLLEARDSSLCPSSLTCSEELMTMNVDSGTEGPDPPLPQYLKNPLV
jgi:hypothetical protein